MDKVIINGTIIGVEQDYDGSGGTWVFLSVRNQDGKFRSIRMTKALRQMDLRFGDLLIAEGRQSAAIAASSGGNVCGLKKVRLERNAGPASVVGHKRGARINECQDVIWYLGRHESRSTIEVSA